MLSLFNYSHIQCIICVCFILDCRISKPITNGKSLLKIMNCN
jgi:hypothetical protein